MFDDNVLTTFLKFFTSKIPQFHLISSCKHFVERRRFHRVSRNSPGTLQKLCLSRKFLHQKIP